MMHGITISIVSHGHGKLLGALLEDLHKFVPELSIIVTANIPEAEIDPLSWPGVEFRHNSSPKGFGANHNAALRTADSEWFAIVNPDIRLTSETFQNLASAIDMAPQVAMFAPKIVDPDGRVEDSARMLPTPTRVLGRALGRITGRRPDVDPVDRASWFAGMFLLVRRDAFLSVGGFDEKFFMYGEDVALSVQLVAAGNQIRMVPDAVVIHDARRASLRSLKHLRWHVASLIRLWTSRSFYLHERRFKNIGQ